MSIIDENDDKFESVLSIENKCTRLNLNENIYGTFAEIGAGQETVRHFFQGEKSQGNHSQNAECI